MNRSLPLVGAPRRLPGIPVHEHTFQNGMRAVVVERRELPIVDIDVVVMRGAALDMPGHAGRVSMTAEMLDEGTRARDVLEIASQLDYLGAHLDVQASWDTVTTTLHVLSGRLDAALDVFADVVLHPAFPEDEFRRKRAERLTALQQDRDEAGILAGQALSASVFGPEHPYGAPLGGTTATIQHLTSAAVQELHSRHFTAGNACIIVVGDVETAAILETLEQRLTSWSPAVSSLPDTLGPIPVLPQRVLLVDKPGAAQAELRVGHAGPPRSTPDYFALTVINAMLGGSFTSRLNTILRERMGVTYGASSRFRMRTNGGLFTAGGAILTEAVARSAQVIIEELERMVSEPVAAGELARAQSYLALGLPRSFETTEDIAAHLREQVVYGFDRDYWETYVDNIFAVTPTDVASAAARHLHPDHCAVVVVADRKDVQKALEDAQLGEVVLTDVAT